MSKQTPKDSKRAKANKQAKGKAPKKEIVLPDESSLELNKMSKQKPKDSKRCKANKQAKGKAPKKEIVLPDEMLENIFNYVGNPRDLLSCRAVSRLWKQEATKVLQKRGPGDLVKWHPLQTRDWIHPPILPHFIIPKAEKRFIAYYPNGNTELDESANPLFTQSLCLFEEEYRTSTYPYLKLNLSGREKFPVLSIFSMYPTCLTSLSLTFSNHGPTRQLDDFTQLLGQCPNLEALQIQGGTINWGRTSRPLPHLPKLTRMAFVDAYNIDQLLLEKYASQLIFLDLLVSPDALAPENYAINEGVSQPFEKLEMFKYTHVNKRFLIGTRITSELKRLSVLEMHYELTFKDLIDYVTRFKDTLVELSVGYLFHYDIQQDDYPGTYQKLTTFGMLAYHQGNNMLEATQMNNMKRHFLSKFPKLKKLEILLPCKVTLEEVLLYTEIYDLWAFCSELEVIHFLVTKSYREQVRAHTLYRPHSPTGGNERNLMEGIKFASQVIVINVNCLLF